VIFLTERATTEERIRGYQAGCDVYLPKPFEMDELGAVIRNLLERSQIIQSEWHYKEYELQRKNSEDEGEDDTPVLDLTPREQDVLNFLTDGLSNSEIGQKLHLSPRTVEKYVSSLLRKTLTSNRSELLKFSLEHRLVKK
jgi:DNA-binding NarL/FixJ family response regulator